MFFLNRSLLDRFPSSQTSYKWIRHQLLWKGLSSVLTRSLEFKSEQRPARQISINMSVLNAKLAGNIFTIATGAKLSPAMLHRHWQLTAQCKYTSIGQSAHWFAFVCLLSSIIIVFPGKISKSFIRILSFLLFQFSFSYMNVQRKIFIVLRHVWMYFSFSINLFDVFSSHKIKFK